MATKTKTKTASEYLLETSKEYAIYICESRGLPNVADGLKDVQRKALWLMRNKSEKIKTVSMSGEMISSNLYLHGDTSASDSISKLAAPYANNIPLIFGIGNFGTRIAPVKGIGAPRYTYVKKYKVTESLVYPDLDIIPLKENYDGSTQEPVHFLPIVPLVLLNGISGLAVGWSTDILPHNLKDIIEATEQVLLDKPVKQLVPYYERYDVKVKHLEGNSWEFEGRVEITDTSTIVVKELPPDLTLEQFKTRLNKLEEENKINGYIDRSTDKINITIKMARGSIKDWTEEQAIEYFKLRQKGTQRLVVIDFDGKSIRQYATTEELIRDFVSHRLKWYTRRYEHYIENAADELTFWEALKMCFDKKLPSKIQSFKNKTETEKAVRDITAKLEDIGDHHIERILGLPIYRWAVDSYEDILAKISNLSKNIEEWANILSDEQNLKNIYLQELAELKKLKI
jgi:DNA gyrase/topoisomerase IV subunit A